MASGCAVSSTERASQVSTSQAVVSGTIASTVGGPTEWWFEYGPTTGYGEETERRVEDLSDEPWQVWTTLRDLQPETVYHFRLCSQDSETDSPPGCSGDRSFATPIRCGKVLTQDTKLEADMTCPTGSALVIGAPGITVDLAGHTVQSGSPFAGGDWIGIDNAGGHDGVIVKNGTVRYDAEFDNGPGRAIVFDDGSDGLLQNLTTLGDIELDGDRNRLAGGSTSAYAATAVTATGDDNQVLDMDVACTDGTALEITGARNRVADSSLGGAVGLRLAGTGVVLVRNDIEGGRGSGALVEGSAHRLIDNDLRGGVGYGLSIMDATNVVVRENRLDGGTDAPALSVAGSTGTILNLNRVSGFGRDGIFVDAGSTNTLLRFNHVSSMLDDGIDVDSASTSLNSNTANENGDLGIEAVAGVTDLGGNLAARNGNPLQCQNVVCQ